MSTPVVMMLQGTPLGQGSLDISVPDGLLLDDQGASITKAAVSPTDFLTALVAIAAATIDLKSNHTNFTLNNMIACLVATDILQVQHDVGDQMVSMVTY